MILAKNVGSKKSRFHPVASFTSAPVWLNLAGVFEVDLHEESNKDRSKLQEESTTTEIGELTIGIVSHFDALLKFSFD